MHVRTSIFFMHGFTFNFILVDYYIQVPDLKVVFCGSKKIRDKMRIGIVSATLARVGRRREYLILL